MYMWETENRKLLGVLQLLSDQYVGYDWMTIMNMYILTWQMVNQYNISDVYSYMCHKPMCA